MSMHVDQGNDGQTRAGTKVEPVPGVPKISVLVQDEAAREDLEDHLSKGEC